MPYYNAQQTAMPISIHAPPRGATFLRVGHNLPVIISIHAPPRGATMFFSASSILPLNFNSRPSARGDDSTAARYPHWYNFNSRPSARGDVCSVSDVVACSTFQFTPLREGRLVEVYNVVANNQISIHAPPRGATNRAGRRSLRVVDFNSRPSARGDPLLFFCWAKMANFNSRPSARGDSKRYAISANLLFNPCKSAWLNNSATQFVEIILVIFHRIIA